MCWASRSGKRPGGAHSTEMQDRLREAIRRAAAGHLVRFEATHLAADDTLNYVDFSLKAGQG